MAMTSLERTRKWRSNNLDRVRALCREYAARRFKANPEKVREGKRLDARRRRAANPEHAKELSRAARKAGKRIAAERRYRGLPTPTRPEPAVCECCGRTWIRRLALDHCHVSIQFRGWLCGKCNAGIGQLGDDVKGLMNAVRYLERAAKQQAPHEQ